MKLTSLFLAGTLLGAVAISSCKKASTTPTTPTPTTSSNPSPVTGNVDGALISLRLDLASVVAGFPITISTDNGIATFFTATGNSSSFVDGGAVSLNTYALAKQSNNSYLKTATTGQTPDNLNIADGTSNWVVAGAGSVPAFTYANSYPFPDFAGTIPTSITRSKGLTVTLGSSVNNADSVIIFIVTNDHKSLTRTFVATAASATISATDLGTLPAVSDNTALIEIIPYRLNTSRQGSKVYAYVKEHAYTANINIQ
jgi:hypothetical protein